MVLSGAIVLFVVIFWRLGAPSFWDPDEAHYAETSRELVATGDWLAPHYNDQLFFDKPILFHWLQAASMGLAGPTEFSARLVPAIAAGLLVVVTAWTGVVLLSTDAAVVAALVLATNPAVFALARYAILDTLFTLFLFGGAALVAVAALERRRRGLQWWGYTMIALAVLTKGPLALVLCGLATGLVALWSADVRRGLLELRLFAGLALVVALALPWFIYMWLRFGDAFTVGYLLDENLRLYATNRFGPGPSMWFYFRVLAVGLVPWTALLAGRLLDDVRAALRRDGTLDSVEILLWGWTIAIVGFFTASRFKLDHYVFPAAPALCLICGRSWSALRQRPRDSHQVGARIGLQLVGPTMMAVALVGGYLLAARLLLPRTALLAPLAVGLAGADMTVRLNLGGGRLPRAPWAVVGAMTLTYVALVLSVLPALEERKVVPDMARWVAAQAAGTDRVASYRLDRWNTAFRFYVGRHVAMIDAPEEARTLFQGTAPFYCTMLRSAYEEFVAQGVPLRIVYQREGMWVTSGRALWQRGFTPTQFVVVSRGP